MIEKDIPYYPLYLTLTDTAVYPRYALPEGYEFVFYQAGDEFRWAQIECDVGQFESVEEGVACFRREFLEGQTLRPESRMLFVRDAAGEYVATLSLWNGMFLGEERQRLHWLAVKDKCAGKGIAKALLTRALMLYNELGYRGFLYLLTASPYYSAIAMYRKLGFVEFTGPSLTSRDGYDEDFVRQTRAAIETVDALLAKQIALDDGSHKHLPSDAQDACGPHQRSGEGGNGFG